MGGLNAVILIIERGQRSLFRNLGQNILGLGLGIQLIDNDIIALVVVVTLIVSVRVLLKTFGLCGVVSVVEVASR